MDSSIAILRRLDYFKGTRVDPEFGVTRTVKIHNSVYVCDEQIAVQVSDVHVSSIASALPTMFQMTHRNTHNF